MTGLYDDPIMPGGGEEVTTPEPMTPATPETSEPAPEEPGMDETTPPAAPEGM